MPKMPQGTKRPEQAAFWKMESCKMKMTDSRKRPVYKKDWIELTPKEKFERELYLDVLSEARKENRSLSRIVREKNESLSKKDRTSVKDVVGGTNAFTKIRGRWKPKKKDRISIPMNVFENGIDRSVQTRDSRVRSMIGRYHNAVKRYLNDNKDVSALRKFRNKRFRDADGKSHGFETDPEKLDKINRTIEEPEFYELYAQ
jgi:hypothetical protein